MITKWPATDQSQDHQHTVGKTVRVQANAQFVHAEPGPGRHDVADDRQQSQSALADQAARMGVQHDGIPRAR